jgi:hypothetical protein
MPISFATTRVPGFCEARQCGPLRITPTRRTETGVGWLALTYDGEEIATFHPFARNRSDAEAH